MIPMMRCGEGRRGNALALALALGIWIVAVPAARGDGGGFAGPGQGRPGVCVHNHPAARCTAPGCAGRARGFQGFGLGYHPGYGYGGDALGVGPDGGYPFYGGPGYPSCEPRLRRCGGITPFPYYGGPGYPTPDQPNVFGGVGPLVADQPVITIEGDAGASDPAGGYGPYSGVLPYPESVLAPATAAAAAPAAQPGGGANPPPPPPSATRPEAPAEGAVPEPSVARRTLGIEAEPVVDAGGVRGLKVSRVAPGTAAKKAGLQAGDVIHAINGYRTLTPGNLTWILDHAARTNVLTLSVRTAGDGDAHVIRAEFP